MLALALVSGQAKVERGRDRQLRVALYAAYVHPLWAVPVLDVEYAPPAIW